MEAACAVDPPDPAAFRELYARMLDRGFGLPLFLASDLAALYHHGTRAMFRPPAGAEAYGEWLRDAAGRGPLQAVLEQVRQSPGADGVVAFLEVVAAALWRIDALLGHLRQLPTGDQARGSDPNHAADPQVRREIGEFLAVLLGSGGSGKEVISLGRVFDPPEARALVVGASRVPGGAAGLDLRLLQDCFAYRPADSPERRRQRQLLGSLSPVPDRSRSPEGGNNGITRLRGPVTTIVKSHLAREPLADRIALNQVLYNDRPSVRRHPRQVLLAWVVDLGTGSESRTTTGRRVGSAARSFVARCLEDAARLVATADHLAVSASVLLYQSGPGGWRGQQLLLTPLDLRRSAGMRFDPWLPFAPGFLPYFFNRHPQWAARSRGVRPADPVAPDADPLRSAVRAVARVPRVDENGTADPDAPPFDLIDLTVVGPADESERRVQGRPPARRFSDMAAGRVHTSHLAVARERLDWTHWPKGSANPETLSTPHAQPEAESEGGPDSLAACWLREVVVRLLEL